MNETERQAFLADMHVGVMGIADDKRGPLTVPVWYSYEPGGDVVVLTSPDSRKAKLVDAAGRFSMCAQQEALPYKYVMVEGPVVEVRDSEPGEIEKMAIRYLGEEAGRAYAVDSAGGSVVYSMRPERWYSVDYGS
ncbi:MAG: pyridoxamine 5'-phosphate oxidase [Actinobacteria bacterium]|nr:pyridoxamine 5'-phosphate oxidase [Actinomycetota bacterium]